MLQLAFSVLLLTSAGLAQRSLSLQDSLDVGFDPARHPARDGQHAGGAATADANAALLEQLRSRLAALPGVEQVT